MNIDITDLRAKLLAAKPADQIVLTLGALPALLDELERLREAAANIRGAVEGWTWIPERGDILTYLDDAR